MGTAKSTKISPDDARQKLHDIVKATRNVVLLTHGEDHKIVGRPMSNVRTDDDTTVYLVANIGSKKISELQRDPRVTLSVQGKGGTAMVDAEARVSQDRALIDELWEDQWNVWFEGGKSDPEIAIVILSPIEGTYWDGDLGHGLSYLWRMVKARVSGHEIEKKPGDQEKVDLGPGRRS